MYLICYIGSRYNSTRLYYESCFISQWWFLGFIVSVFKSRWSQIWHKTKIWSFIKDTKECVILYFKVLKINPQGSKFHSSHRLRRVKMTVRQVEYLQDLSDGQLTIFSCDQAALQMVFSVRPSVRLSVCPSVCHTFLTMFPSLYHHEIFRSYYQWPK